MGKVVDSNQGNWSAVRSDRVERSVQADDHGHSTGALPACRGFKGHCDLLPLPSGCHWPATPTQSNSIPQCVRLHVTPLRVYLPASILPKCEEFLAADPVGQRSSRTTSRILARTTGAN